jgi:chitin disaccharide deacetylase
MTRTLALCADDFGQSPAISAGILRLAQAGRLSAVSCRVNGASWLTDAPALQSLPATVEIGLHFNLTEGRPLSPRMVRLWPTLPALLPLAARAHLGLLPRGPLRGEFHAQLRAFTDATGISPSFVSGHQHVHGLPIVRDLLLDAAEHMRPVPSVRNTGRILGAGFGFKRWLIEASSGRGLARELVQRELAHNPALLGVYDFKSPDYRALVQGWLAQVPAEGALLVCHPGDGVAPGAQAARDPIAAARPRELAYLESAAFTQDLAQAGVVLGPVWRMRSRPQAAR